MSEDSVFNRGSYEEFHCVYDEKCPVNGGSNILVPAVNTELTAQVDTPRIQQPLFRSGGDGFSTATEIFGLFVIIFIFGIFIFDSIFND